MGWTVYYSGTADSPLTDAERKLLDLHVAEWAAKLDEGSEAYAYDEEDDGKKIVGFTKVQFSTDAQADFETIVRATQAIETLLPRWSFLVHDDHVIEEETKPSDTDV